MISLITAGPHWSCDSSCTVPRSKKCSWWVLTTRGNMHISFYRLSCLYNRGKPFFSPFVSLSFFLFCHLVQNTKIFVFLLKSRLIMEVCAMCCVCGISGIVTTNGRCVVSCFICVFCTFRGLKLSLCEWSPTFLLKLDDCGESMRTHMFENFVEDLLDPARWLDKMQACTE